MGKEDSNEKEKTEKTADRRGEWKKLRGFCGHAGPHTRE